jgi:hypothetical protein
MATMLEKPAARKAAAGTAAVGLFAALPTWLKVACGLGVVMGAVFAANANARR